MKHLFWLFLTNGDNTLEHRDAASLLCLLAIGAMLVSYFVVGNIEESLLITLLAYVGGNGIAKKAFSIKSKKNETR